MNAPVTPPVPTYRQAPLFPLGKDKTPYRKLDAAGVRTEKVLGRDVLVVPAAALKVLAVEANNDINHRLRAGQLSSSATTGLPNEAIAGELVHVGSRQFRSGGAGTNVEAVDISVFYK